MDNDGHPWDEGNEWYREQDQCFEWLVRGSQPLRDIRALRGLLDWSSEALLLLTDHGYIRPELPHTSRWAGPGKMVWVEKVS